MSCTHQFYADDTQKHNQFMKKVVILLGTIEILVGFLESFLHEITLNLTNSIKNLLNNRTRLSVQAISKYVFQTILNLKPIFSFYQIYYLRLVQYLNYYSSLTVPIFTDPKYTKSYLGRTYLYELFTDVLFKASFFILRLYPRKISICLKFKI